MNFPPISALACIIFLLLSVISPASTVSPNPWVLPGMFSEGMILQRDVSLPVWGWGPEGETLKVRLADQTREAVVKDGKWQVEFDAMPAGGPHSMIFEPKDETLIQTFTQVLIGDVWLICGQSNVLMPLDESEGAKEAVDSATALTDFRILEIGHRNPHNAKGKRELPVGFWGNPRWESAAFLAPRSSKTDIPGGPTAVGFYFGREIFKTLEGKVPLGLIQVGAIMPAQSWVAEEEIHADPDLAPLSGKGYPDATSACFNANISPLAPFPVRGFLYYQGEMNSGDQRYAKLLTALIQSWRKAWKNEKLPFLIVQLPGYGSTKPEENQTGHALDMPEEILKNLHADSANHGFTVVRNKQLETRLNVPGTGLAVTIDVGDPYDIHPPKKREVGERLALLARKLSYGEKELLAEGPLPLEANFSGKQATVTFLNADGGLNFSDGKAAGFEAAGADGKFLPAEAKIDGKKVVISSKDGKDLQAVRYAWAGFPQISLFNKAGLPASPFVLEK